MLNCFSKMFYQFTILPEMNDDETISAPSQELYSISF